MGLDQSLSWIAEPSKSQVKRLRHKNLSEWNYTIGMAYISETDFRDERYKYIRDFIAERCRILAVVGLHGNTFKPHTGTKTSVLFVQKWDDKLCPKKDDYPIFFATMQKPSKDNSGDKIYLSDPDTGLPALDEHNHLIVDHDLYQLSYKKRDGSIVNLAPGIAEAFVEFAKKEGLSFFR